LVPITLFLTRAGHLVTDICICLLARAQGQYATVRMGMGVDVSCYCYGRRSRTDGLYRRRVRVRVSRRNIRFPRPFRDYLPFRIRQHCGRSIVCFGGVTCYAEPMEHVYLLHHVREDDEFREDAKLIGAYRSKAVPEQAISRLSRQPGFCDYPQGFEIGEMRLDKDHWEEGFVRLIGVLMPSRWRWN